MTQTKKKLIIVLIVLFLIVTGITLYRHFLTRVGVAPMSTHDRVVDVVARWGNTSKPPADAMQLQVVWATSGKQFGFYPEAAQLLSEQMQKEFRESHKNVLQVTDIYDSTKNPNGSVKTVLELSRVVRSRYQPPQE